MHRLVIAAVVFALASCGGGAPALEVSMSGEYEFAPTFRCLKTVRSLRTYTALPLGGEPIRSITIMDSDQQELVTIYIAPSAAVARQAGDVRVDDPELDLYGNVVVEWRNARSEAVDALNRCLR
jgi:hypothetical protein